MKLNNFNAGWLYLISPLKLQDDFLKKLDIVIRLGADFISAFQLRLKNYNDETILACAQKIKPILAKRNIALIINDNVEIALTSGAAGVHLGADDCSIETALAQTNSDFIIGASAYDSIDIAHQAARAGADYVCFGAFFASTTKLTKTKANPSLLRDWKNLSALPAGAIGGITPANAANIIKAGADFIAVSGAIWQARDITKTIEQFKIML